MSLPCEPALIAVSEKPDSVASTSVKSVARQIPSASAAQLNMDHASRQNVSAGQAAAMAIQVSCVHSLFSSLLLGLSLDCRNLLFV